MRPAFTSTWQLGFFVCTLLGLLILPFTGRWYLADRSRLYSAAGLNWGPYPWIKRQIFDETNDIDIAFIGSSRIYWGIDTPQVQKALSRHLGHPATVISICWGGEGFDSDYFAARELLGRRRVKTLVFYDEITPWNRSKTYWYNLLQFAGKHCKVPGLMQSSYISTLVMYSEYLSSRPNPKTPFWYCFADDTPNMHGLSVVNQANYYLASVISAPINLVERLAPDLDENHAIIEDYLKKGNPEKRLGSYMALRIDGEAFIEYTPITQVRPADAVIYSENTRSNFVVMPGPLPDLETHFAQKFAAEAQAHHCRLVYLHIPTTDQSNLPVLEEPCDWSQMMHAPVAELGIPPAKMLAELTPDQLAKILCFNGHLNANGQKYFTSLITPALIQLYDTQKTP
jgi:hypothetical protein